MHLACHLHGNIFDYGPLAAFWAFSFEHYNGILENTKILWYGPEKQMFIKSLGLQSLSSVEATSDNESVKHMLSEISTMQLTSNFSAVDQMAIDTSFLVKPLQQYSCQVKYIDAVEKSCYKLVPPLREKCFNDIEMEHLKMFYGILYPGYTVTQISCFYHESKQLVINGEDLITAKSRLQHSAAVAAHWPGVLGIDISGEAPVRIGTVVSFFCHSATLKDKTSDTSFNPCTYTGKSKLVY